MEETRYICIKKAYDDLSHEAFSIWVLIHSLDAKQLRSGRTTLARMASYSVSRLNVVIRELRRKGYILLTRGNKLGVPTIIELEKICKISNNDKFVKLNNFLSSVANFDMDVVLGYRNQDCEGHNQYCECSNADSCVQENCQKHLNIGTSHYCQNQKLDSLNINKQLSLCSNTSSKSVNCALKGIVKLCKDDETKDEDDNCQTDFDNIINDRATCLSMQKDFQNNTGNILKRKKFLTPGGGIILLSNHLQKSQSEHVSLLFNSNSLSLNLKSKILSSKSNNLELNKETKLTIDLNKEDNNNIKSKKSSIDIDKIKELKEKYKKKISKPSHPEVGKPISWEKLDQRGDPQITFSPDDDERAYLVHVLTTNTRDLEPEERKYKRKLEKKFQSEFIRAYERYRRMSLREQGRSKTTYVVLDSEKKYALKAAVACIVKEVTPRQVLEYWHKHIFDFADKKMPIPPLSFLSQASNVDSVAINAMENAVSWRPNKKDRLPVIDKLSDTSLLHPKFRAVLTEAGFNMSEKDDQYLVYVQIYALDVYTNSISIRLIPSNMRTMVQWAADNFCCNLNPDDFK